MSSPYGSRPGPSDPVLGPAPDGRRVLLGRGAVPPEDRWGGWPEVRADLRAAVVVVAVLTVAGAPLGVAWWALAPRADFRVTEDGPQPVGDPPLELAVADDGVLVLLLLAAGLLAGALAWLPRRRRGVALLAALALGMVSAGVVAWQVGEMLAPGPTDAQLAEVGAVVTTPLHLAAVPALAAGPFAAALAYVLAALLTRTDDLRRTRLPAGAERAPDGTGAQSPEEAGALS
ncbi:hypothetical protein OF117_20425 [Geodermatophilus sp. YIM 151500]|uniref:hypothetical protein n=1 Tax=Geodermatophilus sp. YIM 151500 TaxID=2984531 RepID=UPI0021E36A38|nr:hypothetical protein [Geodermatophilus sp. YIM 151500]MCV2491717.1 hypothetical protein [Geodermatophilus sp. YIM 151500]